MIRRPSERAPVTAAAASMTLAARCPNTPPSRWLLLHVRHYYHCIQPYNLVDRVHSRQTHARQPRCTALLRNVSFHFTRRFAFVNARNATVVMRSAASVCVFVPWLLKALTQELHFWFVGTYSDYPGQVRISRSLGQSQGRRSKITTYISIH